MQVLTPNTIPNNATQIEIQTYPGKFIAHHVHEKFTIHDPRTGQHSTHMEGDYIIQTAAGTTVIPKDIFPCIFIPKTEPTAAPAVGEELDAE